MKEQDIASPKKPKYTPKTLIILAIVLLVIAVFYVPKKDYGITETLNHEIAAITLWSWKDNSTLSSIFGRRPDLKIEILSVGYLDQNGVFVQSKSLSKDYRGVVRIEVKNIGRTYSDSWHIEAALPTDPIYIYESEKFDSINKKESKIFTLSFDKLKLSKSEEISVSVVHPEGEKSTENNHDSVVVEITE